MKDRSAGSQHKTLARAAPAGRRSRKTPPSADPAPPKQRSRAGKSGVAAQLRAEVERLAAELKTSRARVSELEARIDIDPLTETLNRRGFEREFRRSLAYVKRYGASAALLYLDLDEFKPVNDGHGHAAGDAVLKRVAATLVRNVRASDVVARIGGDEFVVLLWNLSADAAVAKARALEMAIAAHAVRWKGSILAVRASAGVASVGPGDAPADILARADAAMYARKAERRQDRLGVSRRTGGVPAG